MALNLSYSLADQDFHHTKSLGVWNVSTQLLRHLAATPDIGRLTVFSNHSQAGLRFPDNVERVPYNSANLGRVGRVCWDQWGVYTAARRAGNPWLFLPKGFAPALRQCPVRLAAYVHDAMHDYYQRNYQQNPLEREAGYFTHSLKATLRQARIIFTNTEFTRGEVRRLAREWNIHAPPIVCAGVGFSARTLDPAHKRNRIVVLAGPWPHKCTPLAIERLKQWTAGRGFHGGVDWIGALPSRTSLPSHPDWRHSIRLSPEEYDQVLSRAAVVVYFSAYEGFGMPPVEGTLAGAAAVYSAIPAMSEVMGECGFRFTNESYAEFAAAMDAAFAAPPAQLAAWRDVLCARHNWNHVAITIVNAMAALETEPTAAPARRHKLPAGTAKILVFAHTPPPHHGQSYMVQQMLAGFGGDQRRRHATPPTSQGIACYHVNSRLSLRLEDIGEARLGKLVFLLGYCLEAVWCRFRHGPQTLYYIPAPGKRAALIRDWMVMSLCRPFFPKLILHWHAAGLPTWLEVQPNRAVRKLTHFLLGRPALSISLSDYSLGDARRLDPRDLIVVPNGIPDPCPDFDLELLPRRLARQQARQQLAAGASMPETGTSQPEDDPALVRILYLAHCTREKGLFDAMNAVQLAQQQLHASRSPFRLKLAICGDFLQESEKREFERRRADPDMEGLVDHVGFVSGDRKDRAFRTADIYCFPTFYYAESFGLVVTEAMAYGLPVITTRWRSVPEVLPPNYPGIVDPNQPQQIADALCQFITHADPMIVRRYFLEHFTIERHLNALAGAIRKVARRE